MPRQITKKEEQIITPKKSRRVRLNTEDSPISETQVESSYPSEEQTQATGKEELTYVPIEEKVVQENDVEKGRVTQITYKTNRKRQDMEHETIEITSSVGDGEDPEVVYVYLKQLGEYLLDNVD